MPLSKMTVRSEGRVLFFRGIDTKSTEDEIREYFSQFGCIISLKMHTDRSEKFNGCGCVEFSGKNDTDNALRSSLTNWFNNETIIFLNYFGQRTTDIVLRKNIMKKLYLR